MPEAMRTEIICHHHANSLANHFDIAKTYQLGAYKYYWPTLWHNIKAYVKAYYMCLALKAVNHKPYDDLQSLPVLIYCSNDLSIDFVTSLSILTN